MENYNQAHRIIDEIQESLFCRLESCRDTIQAQAIEGTIDERLKQIEAVIEKMEIAVNKATTSQRTTLKFKLDQLRYDHKHLLSSFRSLHQRRLTREREQREREELLTRRFTTNAASAALADTQINMGHQEYYDNEKTKLSGFHRNIDEMLSTGGAVLTNLREQRNVLKSAHSRLMEAANTLGLSKTVMRLIEKRTVADKYILFGGMFIFTILMYLIWKYLS